MQKYDSPISVATRLAQLVVESQMFTSELAKKSNNGFGIKASAPWDGDSVPHVSGEVGGARESSFRKYPSEEASIKDHAGFFTSTPFRQ
ncbi:glucosaminidase domain-containing protein, partial [Pseudomonas aeruginosa]|uniref:glucosaminidase domain-containing protein n=1 Tax=Pseudomonas aeruginosa TaxID=287 RepID=UPI003968A60D